MASYTTVILCICVLVLSGCLSTDSKYVTRVETVTVYKPIYTAPSHLQNLEDIDRPDLASNHLTQDDKDNPGEVAKIIIESIAQLRNYAEMLENRVQIYKSALNTPTQELPQPTTEVETYESDKPFEE